MLRMHRTHSARAGFTGVSRPLRGYGGSASARSRQGLLPRVVPVFPLGMPPRATEFRNGSGMGFKVPWAAWAMTVSLRRVLGWDRRAFARPDAACLRSPFGSWFLQNAEAAEGFLDELRHGLFRRNLWSPGEGSAVARHVTVRALTGMRQGIIPVCRFHSVNPRTDGSLHLLQGGESARRNQASPRSLVTT